MSDRSTPRPRVHNWWVLLVLMPLAEIVLLVVVGRWIGVWPTLGLLASGLVVGALVVRRAGRRAWRSLTEAAQAAQSGAESEPVDAEPTGAAMIGLGGVLLMVPGYLTDLAALIVLLPFTRPWARRVLRGVWARWVHRRLGMSPDLLRARMDRGNTVPGSVVPPDQRSASDDRDDPVVIRGEVEP